MWSWSDRLNGVVARLLSRLTAQSRRRDPDHRPPFAPIGGVDDGERVRVRGRALAEAELETAPISGRRCLYWWLTIEELVDPAAQARRGLQSVHAGPRWINRAHDSAVVPFAIEDRTGRASVDVTRFTGWASSDVVRVERALRGFDAHTRALIERYAIPEAPLRRFGGRLRVREGVFELGDELVVLGRARWIEDAPSLDPSYRQSSRVRRLVLEASGDDEVCASDDLDGPY